MVCGHSSRGSTTTTTTPWCWFPVLPRCSATVTSRWARACTWRTAGWAEPTPARWCPSPAQHNALAVIEESVRAGEETPYCQWIADSAFSADPPSE